MDLTEKIDALPRQPGVYLMRDITGTILYVGKAKDLSRRVGSYFRNTDLPPRIRALIHCIRRLDYIGTASERDALILEDRLIKKYQPRYNVLLRDDKTYPYLKLTLKEDFPRLLLIRTKKRDGSRYFGPYPQVSQVRAILRWMQRFFNLRPCSLEITGKKPLAEKKYRSCLYLHIGTCPAPCAGRIHKKKYHTIVRNVLLFLSGDHATLRRSWEREMRACSSRTEFETAAELRDRIRGLERLYERVRIQQVREEELVDRIQSSHALSVLKKALGLPAVPVAIEAFDISNIQGSQPAGSMVRFENGLPKKSGYRHYRVKTVTGPNDTAMMEEVLSRRFSRIHKEDGCLPGLVLLDGGKPQLSAAVKVFRRLGLSEHILAGLAKREEEIFVPARKKPVILEKDSSGLLLLRRIRDEAHRFALAFHTKLRKNNMLPDNKRRR